MPGNRWVKVDVEKENQESAASAVDVEVIKQVGSEVSEQAPAPQEAVPEAVQTVMTEDTVQSGPGQDEVPHAGMDRGQESGPAYPVEEEQPLQTGTEQAAPQPQVEPEQGPQPQVEPEQGPQPQVEPEQAPQPDAQNGQGEEPIYDLFELGAVEYVEETQVRQ
jgi:hypothetical protein